MWINLNLAAKTADWYVSGFVNVEVNLYYNDRLDIDNHGYIAKLVIDSLKGLFIVDDTKKYVKKLTQEFYEDQGILVEIKEYKG